MRITAAEHAGDFRVHLDGVDVTYDCFAADDVEGWVDCYRRASDGAHVVERGPDGMRLASERRFGAVRIEAVASDA